MFNGSFSGSLSKAHKPSYNHAALAKPNRFQKFANISRDKFWKSAVSRCDPARLPKWKEKPAWKASGAVEELKYVRRIAVDQGIPARDLPAIGGTSPTLKCTGSRRLMSQNAGLMVIRSMAHLHHCASNDWEHLCDLIYIIGLGLPVVVASTWRIAGGLPSKLAAQASGIALHAPAALQKPCTFMLDKRLVDAHPELDFALRHCSQRPKSQWNACLDKGQPLAADGGRAATIST